MIVKVTVYNVDTMELVHKEYIEQSDVLLWLRMHTFSDGMPIPTLTVDQVPATAEQVEAFLYLKYTDYYVVKHVETGDDIPAGIATERAAARNVLNNG